MFARRVFPALATVHGRFWRQDSAGNTAGPF
jgi:hypothetical protein